MSPRKKQAVPTTEVGINKEVLAGLGAVLRVVALKREVRAIEKAYPGTAEKADLELQREQMAMARAVKQGQSSTAARRNAQEQTTTRVASATEEAGHVLVGAGVNG